MSELFMRTQLATNSCDTFYFLVLIPRLTESGFYSTGLEVNSMYTAEAERRGRATQFAPLAMVLASAALTMAWQHAIPLRWLEIAPVVAATCVIWFAWRVFHVSALGATLGLVAVDVLILSSYSLYRADCVMTLGFQAPLMLAGLVFMALSGVTFLVVGWKYTRRWNNLAASLVAIFVIPAVFFLAAFPFATWQRRLRHIEEMNEKLPALEAVSRDIEASVAELGRIPTDEAEFYELVNLADHNPDQVLGCCWAVEYHRTGADRFRLTYKALDVEYVYDNSVPERGWQRRWSTRSTIGPSRKSRHGGACAVLSADGTAERAC